MSILAVVRSKPQIKELLFFFLGRNLTFQYVSCSKHEITDSKIDTIHVQKKKNPLCRTRTSNLKITIISLQSSALPIAPRAVFSMGIEEPRKFDNYDSTLAFFGKAQKSTMATRAAASAVFPIPVEKAWEIFRDFTFPKKVFFSAFTLNYLSSSTFLVWTLVLSKTTKRPIVLVAFGSLSGKINVNTIIGRNSQLNSPRNAEMKKDKLIELSDQYRRITWEVHHDFLFLI